MIVASFRLILDPGFWILDEIRNYLLSSIKHPVSRTPRRFEAKLRSISKMKREKIVILCK